MCYMRTKIVKRGVMKGYRTKSAKREGGYRSVIEKKGAIGQKGLRTIYSLLYAYVI